MDFFSKLAYAFFDQRKLGEGVKNEKFREVSFFFIIMCVVQLAALYFTNMGVFAKLFSLDSMQNIPLRDSMIIAALLIGAIISLLLISAMLWFFIKIYENGFSYLHAIKSLVYGLIPIYLTIILVSGIRRLYEIIMVEKPVILLMIIIFSVILLHKIITGISKVKPGFATSALILLALYLYILYIRKLDVIIFYTVMLIIVFIKRKKFTKQNVVLLYKTKMGLNSMTKMARRCPKTLDVISKIGIYLGFAFMLLISVILVDNAIKLIFVPNTLPGASPILPGVPIPGSPCYLPLWEGLLSIFIVVLVHEFSHGVIARLHNIKVKSSGLWFMGPIIGAFVEPDEKTLEKKKKKQQLAVMAAGPLSNIILAAIVLLLLNFAIAPVVNNMVTSNGASIKVIDGTPAEAIGLQDGMVIMGADGRYIRNSSDLYLFLNDTVPGQKITLSNSEGKAFLITLDEHPEREGKGYLGVSSTDNIMVKDDVKSRYGNFYPEFMITLSEFLLWLFIISFGIGIANLIPLGPVDGGRMMYIVLLGIFEKERAKKIWNYVSIGFILLLIFVIFFPLFRWIMGQF